MRTLLVLLVLCAAHLAGAQTAPDTYWVQFTDKAGTPYSVDAPEQFLSARAIARRETQGIAIDDLDLPVDPAYIAGVLATGEVQLVDRSKWFNAVTIRTSDPVALLAIEGLPYVQAVRSTFRVSGVPPAREKFMAPRAPEERGGGTGDYGASFTQVSMINAHLLHAIEAKGQGILIGVLDSGFDRVDSLPGFDALRQREGIVYTKDLVVHDGDVYGDHWHGRSVLSCMAAVMPGYLLGTAPEADYVLVRTEEAATEYLVEEDNWVAGAELCDSLGCDVLNTSLGYTQFDDSTMDHLYADMNGLTARISIAAGIASQKGMVPVNSAGNWGTSEWIHIGAPADAIDILAVGAVGDTGQVAPFSSRGPSADGRVKPDVMAMGWEAIGLDAEGEFVVPINGTSFASPILAGGVACLWQLHPGRTSAEIMDAVRRSASHWSLPSDSMGYGIPDLWAAHLLLDATTEVDDARTERSLSAWPVPFTEVFEMRISGVRGTHCDLQLLDATGRTVQRTRVAVTPDGRCRVAGLGGLPAGPYMVRVADGHGVWTCRVMKQ